MMHDRRQFLIAANCATLSLLLPRLLVGAGDWPLANISVIVAKKPGGGSDAVARMLAPMLEGQIGSVRIGVNNMAGASGAIAARYVRSKPPDGSHWLVAGGYHSGLRPMGLDDAVPWQDWQYYGADASYMSLAVPPDSPIRDLDDLIRRATDDPNRLTMAVDGLGGTWHLAALLLVRATGARFRFIPYDGGKPATVAGLRREVDVVCSGAHEQIGAIKAGRLRHLGTGAERTLRLHGLELESIISRIPGLAGQAPIGGGASMALRRDTDAGVLAAIAEAWSNAVRDPGFQERNQASGRFPSLTIGAQADRRAAQLECISANLLAELGLARHSPADLGLPSIDDFEHWWPPRGYGARISSLSDAASDAAS